MIERGGFAPAFLFFWVVVFLRYGRLNTGVNTQFSLRIVGNRKYGRFTDLY